MAVKELIPWVHYFLALSYKPILVLSCYFLQLDPPYLLRAKAFKSELYDTASVEQKLMQKEEEVIDMKRNVRLKVR